MHQDPSGMLARIPFGLTTGPIEGAEILVAGCRKETVASEMRSNVLKYRDTLITRLLLARSYMLPWHTPQFLEEATARILLRRVGGGYSFPHRLLLDYF